MIGQWLARFFNFRSAFLIQQWKTMMSGPKEKLAPLSRMRVFAGSRLQAFRVWAVHSAEGLALGLAVLKDV